MSEAAKLARIAVVAAVYVVATLCFPMFSYGAIQFRFAEILVLLCFYRKEYCYSLIMGCFIANWFSPLGIIDVVFGTASTIFSVVTMRYIKNFYLAALMPIISMLFIATELALFASEPFWLSLGTTMLGEFAVIVVGVVVFKSLERNRHFMMIIGCYTIKTLNLTREVKAIEPPPYLHSNAISHTALSDLADDHRNNVK